MIINEKKHSLKLLKIRLDSVTDEMYQDLKDTIIQGLRIYQSARREWERVTHVLKEYDEVEKSISVNPAISGNNGDGSDVKLLKTITNEIDLAQKRFEVKNIMIYNKYNYYYKNILE